MNLIHIFCIYFKPTHTIRLLQRALCWESRLWKIVNVKMFLDMNFSLHFPWPNVVTKIRGRFSKMWKRLFGCFFRLNLFCFSNFAVELVNIFLIRSQYILYAGQSSKKSNGQNILCQLESDGHLTSHLYLIHWNLIAHWKTIFGRLFTNHFNKKKVLTFFPKFPVFYSV